MGRTISPPCGKLRKHCRIQTSSHAAALPWNSLRPPPSPSPPAKIPTHTRTRPARSPTHALYAGTQVAHQAHLHDRGDCAGRHYLRQWRARDRRPDCVGDGEGRQGRRHHSVGECEQAGGGKVCMGAWTGGRGSRSGWLKRAAEPGLPWFKLQKLNVKYCSAQPCEQHCIVGRQSSS
eukprot:365480-Chlamydomonas_euryale.AAC.14